MPAQLLVYTRLYTRRKIELGYTSMKRHEIKRRPLADTVLASLEPEPKPYREHDGGGLYFRVMPNGRKSWNFRYKKPSGTWSWIGLGAYPEVGGAMARQRAAEIRDQLSEGRDPLVSQHERKAMALLAESNTFEKLAREWFGARRSSWVEKTARRIIGSLELHVFPVFGARDYTQILPIEWMEFFRSMEQKGIIDQTGNVRRYCRDIYDLARVTGRATHNPIDGLHKFLATKPSDNYPHVTEKELPALIRAIRAYPHARDVCIGLQLLMLTCVRPSELREAAWSEINLDNATWSIPAARMKKRRDHTVPLSDQALALLQELKTLTGYYPLLFPGRNDRTKPRSDMVWNMALRRLGYEGRQTAHGFRHIGSTLLREQGFPRDHVEAQLAHAEEGVAGVYNKAVYLEQRSSMMQWYADHLDALAKGNVIPFAAVDRR